MPGKISVSEIVVEPLSEKHKTLLNGFKSFEKELVDFLKNDALDNQEKKISKTHLFFHKPTGKLSGYITLLTDKISLHAELKEAFKKKGINYKSLPALKIGRLCVHDDFLRMGIGTHMLDWTVFVIKKINEFAGCRFITIDAKRNPDKSRDSIHFYKAKGFEIYKEREKGSTPMYKDLSKLSEE
ncbi:MAG: hypothetical protein HY392_03705 [Candidatus Diapherotrites archaeon]|nr:hypothetical protein [Candidatus Diapherotrites archaeon]